MRVILQKKNKYRHGIYKQISEKVPGGCSLKKVFIKILQNLQENTSAGSSFLIKLQPVLVTLLKKRVRHKCFLMNFAKLLGTVFL